MRKLGVGATVLAVLLLTASAIAAVGATIVLTNGQRVRADIFDMNAQGIVGRVNGSERSWSTGESGRWVCFGSTGGPTCNRWSCRPPTCRRTRA